MLWANIQKKILSVKKSLPVFGIIWDIAEYDIDHVEQSYFTKDLIMGQALITIGNGINDVQVSTDFEVHALVRITTKSECWYDGVCGDSVSQILSKIRKNFNDIVNLEIVSVYDDCSKLQEALVLYEGF